MLLELKTYFSCIKGRFVAFDFNDAVFVLAHLCSACKKLFKWTMWFSVCLYFLYSKHDQIY